MDLNKNSIVVIIDPWRINDANNKAFVGNQEYNNTFANIIKFCQKDFVKTICLASYTDMRSGSIEEPWYSNGKALFSDETRWDLLRQNWNESINNKEGITTDIIRDIKIENDQTQFAIYNTMQLLYYCNLINQSIENIYIMGASWDECVHNRPVGVAEIEAVINANMFTTNKTLLTKQSCVIHSSGNHPSIIDPWILLGDDTYMLPTYNS